MKKMTRPVRDRVESSTERGWDLELGFGDDGFELQSGKKGEEMASQPLFVQIAHALTREIRQGRLVPGSKLPSSRKLATQLSVHRNTVLAAYAELRAEGWIETDPARATLVSQSLPENLLGRSLTRGSSHLATGDLASSRRDRVGFKFEQNPDSSVSSLSTLWSGGLRKNGDLVLSSGTPDLRLLPVDAMARAYRRALRMCRNEVLGYGDPQGQVRLRGALASMLTATRGLTVASSDILVTRGAQMAIDLVARILLRPKDVIAVEEFGYRPAWAAFRGQGARLMGIPIDSEGLQVEFLAQLIAKQKIRAVYLTPHHQYPTTVTLSASRRLRLLELARHHRFAIIEDDYDHEFHYEGRPVFPLASADEAGVVIYIGTLSKILAPGLRVGYMVAPNLILRRAVEERMHIDRQGDLAVEYAIADLIEDGEVQRHAHRMRRVYHARRNRMVQAVSEALSQTLEFQVPAGGMALWTKVRAKVTENAFDLGEAEAWAQRALKQGVVVQTSKSFALNDHPRPYLRLGFASLDEEEIVEAVDRLARTL